MKGILRKIQLKEYSTGKGVKFKKLNYECDVKINDNGDVMTLKGSYSEEFARKYFAYCEVKTKDLVGKEVGVVIAKKTYEKEGEERIYTYIKFMNILDENGNAIVMPSNGSEEIDF